MGFILPSALALVGLAIPIVIFYMLKLRRQPAHVSSLMLWEQVLADRQANAPWQKNQAESAPAPTVVDSRFVSHGSSPTLCHC